ncbi:HEPN domain-containing protein [Pseudopedobacter beijingensis]|uniref:HEPN domain-containing protein n=1 Tax=Pseudopedobacter beijingensis TaxID=1207056 RepID=A0ABW4IEW0_9SPHI
METTILAKPENTKELNALVSLLLEKFNPLQIYLYAYYEEQSAYNSIFREARQQGEKVFYLLVVTEGTASMENAIQQYVDACYKEAKAIIHAHGEETLRLNLNQCNGYFTAVLNRGVLLYSADGLLAVQAVQGPNAEKQLLRIKEQWEHRIHLSKGFLHAAEEAVEHGDDPISIYLMYQAVEQTCVGLIAVFMGYKTDIRNLRRLLYVCGCFSKKPLQHFMGSPENEQLLNIMMKSFSEVRYGSDFDLEGRSPFRFLELAEGFVKLAEGMVGEL